MKYVPGSPRDVYRRLSKLHTEVSQIIRDVRHWNTIHPGEVPMDVGADLVFLRKVEAAIRANRLGDREQLAAAMKELVESNYDRRPN